jgi:ABC-type multidrug transport system fused ATPase/permease subunit
MDHGDVVESGNHQELLEANGVYSDIYNSQFLSEAA